MRLAARERRALDLISGSLPRDAATLAKSLPPKQIRRRCLSEVLSSVLPPGWARELFPHVTSLDIYAEHLDADLLRAIGELRNLRSLSLYHCKVDSGAFGALAALPRLESLDLALTDVTDDGIVELLRAPSLQWLSVAETPVTDRMVQRLRAARPGLDIVHSTVASDATLEGQ